MADNQKPQNNQSIFSLIRLKPQCRITPTLVDFAPPFPTSTNNPLFLPTFNQDHCPFTPAFILPADQKKLSVTFESQKLQFDMRVRKANELDSPHQPTLEKITSITPPSQYCQICRENFQHYAEHIEQKCHLLRMTNNEFNLHIEQLCCLFRESPNIETTPKKKQIKKTKKNLDRNIKNSPRTKVSEEQKMKGSTSCLMQQGQKQSFEL